MTWRTVALIPARAGSQRLPGKNTRLLQNHPVIAYTIRAAFDSGVFDEVFVSSEDPRTLRIAHDYGAKPLARDEALSRSDTPDIAWVRSALNQLAPMPHIFGILRPTSPCRTAETIRKAAGILHYPDATCDSVRAVRKVTEHPGKMWTWRGPGYAMSSLIEYPPLNGVPAHSSPTQGLPPVYVQTGACELAWTSNVTAHGTIAGRKIAPLVTEGPDAWDLNTQDDWDHLLAAVHANPSLLPCL